MTHPPYTARVHRRIDVLLIGLAILILFLILLSSAHAGSWAAWAGDRTPDRYVVEDSSWAERAASFFPRYHFTLQATTLRSVSRDSGGGSAPRCDLGVRYVERNDRSRLAHYHQLEWQCPCRAAEIRPHSITRECNTVLNLGGGSTISTSFIDTSVSGAYTILKRNDRSNLSLTIAAQYGEFT